MEILNLKLEVRFSPPNLKRIGYPKNTIYMKNKTILVGMLGIFLISFTSAISLSSGECGNLIFPNNDSVQLEILLNSSNMDGFSWYQEGSLITYCFDELFESQSLTLKFYNSQEVFISSGGGGGSSSIPKIAIKIYPSYVCSEWEECTIIGQTRTCVINGESLNEDVKLTHRACEFKEKVNGENSENSIIPHKNESIFDEEIIIEKEKNFFKDVWTIIKKIWNYIF